MIITKLYLGHFGKFCDKEIILTKGVNVLYGENEVGKSTIHAFIRGMLFGIEPKKGRSAKDDIYKKYLPWKYPGAFDGRMDIIYRDVPYQLQRSFHKNNKYFSVLNLQTGREVELLHGSISDLIEGLTESTYMNTISIAQLKAKTDETLANQLQNFITNLSVGRSNEVDVGAAILQLTNRKKQLEAILKSDELDELKDLICVETENEKKIDELIIRLKELSIKERDIENERQSLQIDESEETLSEMEKLPAMIEKYKQFIKLEEKGKELDEQYLETIKKRDLMKKEKSSLEMIEMSIKEIKVLDQEIVGLEEEERSLLEENKIWLQKKKTDILISMLPSGMAILLGVALFGFKSKGVWAIVLGILIGMGLYLVRSRKTQINLSNLEAQIKQCTQKILSCNGRKKQLILQNQVLEYQDLINKHQRILEQVYKSEYYEQQITDLSLQRDSMLQQTDELYEEILAYMQKFLKEEVLCEETMEKLIQYIQNKKQQISVRIKELNQLHQNCHLEIEKIKWNLNLLDGNEEALLSNQERYDELLITRQEILEELEAVKLAIGTIQELAVDIHDGFGQELNQVVNQVVSAVTNGRYDDIKIDERLNMKLGHSGTFINIEDLSAGTIDQIYFALRIAVADLVLGKNQMPIILDDSFALYDAERVQAALDFLKDRLQIILFTCHKREEEILKRKQQAHHYIQL